MSGEPTDPFAQKMRDFAYSVSHDLNAPLRAASSFSKILLENHAAQLDTKGREYLGIIATESARAQAMIQGLLEYSRLDTMAKTLTTRIETARVFEHCTLILKEEAERVHAHFTATDLPIIQADAEQFMQLLLYLFDNAIKFAAPGIAPDIHFNGVEEGNAWHFTVRDHGIGIEPAYAERAFKLFRQLHPQGTYPGIGVGLTLAQKIVERHGGRIWIETNEDAGITVHFTTAKQ